MTPPATRRIVAIALGLVGLGTAFAPPTPAPAGTRAVDPALVVPLDKIPAEVRDSVVEVIRDHTMHRRGSADTFPCHSKVYLSLLNEPAVTLALWQDLAQTPVRLQRIDANRYQGSDGVGTSASWQYVYRSPKLHVLLSDLDYQSPRGPTKLNGRIVLVVHSGFYREVNGEPWIQHDVEAFVKVDSKGWKALAKTIRPVLEKVLEDQVHEAGLFVSLMGRLVENYPNWACSVVVANNGIDASTRASFRDVVTQSKRPNASTGRPQMLAEGAAQAGAETKRR